MRRILIESKQDMDKTETTVVCTSTKRTDGHFSFYEYTLRHLDSSLVMMSSPPYKHETRLMMIDRTQLHCLSLSL